VLPLAAELPVLLVEPVEPTRVLVAEGAPVLAPVDPVLSPVALVELPVLPLAAELPVLLVEPVEPTRVLVAEGAPVLAPVDPVLSPVPVAPPDAVLGALVDVPVLVPVDGADVVS